MKCKQKCGGAMEKKANKRKCFEVCIKHEVNRRGRKCKTKCAQLHPFHRKRCVTICIGGKQWVVMERWQWISAFVLLSWIFVNLSCWRLELHIDTTYTHYPCYQVADVGCIVCWTANHICISTTSHSIFSIATILLFLIQLAFKSSFLLVSNVWCSTYIHLLIANHIHSSFIFPYSFLSSTAFLCCPAWYSQLAPPLTTIYQITQHLLNVWTRRSY